jgi:hypothetical protein
MATGALPVTAVGTVQAVGFGSAEISVGSTAAAMMSVKAIAGGGSIAAGGAIASSQSMGAVGMAGALPITSISLAYIGACIGLAYGIYSDVNFVTKRFLFCHAAPIKKFPQNAIKAQNGKVACESPGWRMRQLFFYWQMVHTCRVIKAESNHIREWEMFII